MEGHTTANHTMFHTKGLQVNTAQYMQEVEACARITKNKLFRPPYGRMRQAQYKALIKKGYQVIMWDVISYDYEKISPDKCLQNVIKHTRNGSIVLFHDNLKANDNLRFTLPEFLLHYTQQGYRFSAIPE
jgi:peptidoglycan/xylan/chitin deacetylase (PgdA/CDA1 family)